MQLVYTPIVLAALFSMQTAQADIISDSELIMDNAQKVYTQFFPTPQETQVLDPWRFRFYPKTGIYVGVNQQDSGVYLLGGVFGDSPFYIDKTDTVLTLLNNQLAELSESAPICNTSSTPDGFTYTQDGNTVNVTTSGQCLKLANISSFCDVNPENDADGAPVSTNIHVLIELNIQNLELQGLPGFENIIKEQMGNQKVCIIHAPTKLINYTVNADICMDVSDDFSDFGAEVVTVSLLSSSVNTQVKDCFATDATTISNIITQETWVTDVAGGDFRKVN